MVNPTLPHLLHADPAPQQQLYHPQQQQQQHHHHQQQQEYQQHQPPQPGQSPTAGNLSSGLAPVSGSFTYPPPPSTASPAASATPNPLATPAASPTAQHTPNSASGSASGSVPKSHANNTSLYQCADCLKRYSRPEHLQRHIATHTLGKRFVCDICSKAFGRADLLKRHRTNHDDDANGTKRRRINSSPGAGRVAHACQACAKARVKCEEIKPCTRCRNRNLHCEYASSEAGSAAAMHLLHLSAQAHSGSAAPSSAALVAQSPMGPLSHNLASDAMISHQAQGNQSIPMAGLSTPAAPTMTNPVYGTQSTDSPPVMVNHAQANNEAAQLPTPETMIDQNIYQAQYGQPFGDFLQRILYDQQQQQQHQQQHQHHQHQQQQQQHQQQHQQQQHQQQMDPSRMGVAQGISVLDFCDDANLDMNEMDYGMLDQWNLGNIQDMLATDPNLATYVSAQPEDTADMSNMRKRLVSIWSDSPWRFTPDGTKDNINVQKSNLPLGDIPSSHLRPADKVVQDVLDSSARDKILAIVLSTCTNNAILSRVASSFPSTEVMDSLMHVFLAWHMCQVSEYVHFGSFSMNAQCPEWLGMAASAGAILTPVKALRKFGYALQEAVRVAIPNKFEDNNTRIQDMSLVQALVLNHDIGLWSGNRRRMEIAECHLNIPVAMTRGRGRFSSSNYPPIQVDTADDGAVLEEKWKRWVEQESWKRLIFHLYIRDAQISMTSMSNPHMSYAEMTLPLPESRELWFARTAQDWKVLYLERNSNPQNQPPTQPPSLGDLLRDFRILANEHHRIDLQYTVSIFLHGFSAMIREWHQMATIFRWTSYSHTMGSNPNLLLDTRREVLVTTLEQLQQNSLQQTFSAQENVLLNLLLMNLHVSLENLELFAGKQGDEQAKRIVPTLQRWAQDTESKRAIWHAGQILRWAREFPTGHLKDFYAVAVHHAALALWTWGIMTWTLKQNGSLPNTYQNDDVIYLDMHDSAQMQVQVRRFIDYGTGRPAIRRLKKAGGRQGAAAAAGASGSGNNNNGGGTFTTSFVEEPGSCMHVVEDIFRANFLEGHTAPIVENLCHLVKQLGNAAGLVGRG